MSQKLRGVFQQCHRFTRNDNVVGELSDDATFTAFTHQGSVKGIVGHSDARVRVLLVARISGCRRGRRVHRPEAPGR